MIGMISFTSCSSEQINPLENDNNFKNYNSLINKTYLSDSTLIPEEIPVNEDFLKKMEENTGLNVTGKCKTVNAWSNGGHIHIYTVQCGTAIWEVWYLDGIGWSDPHQIK